MRRARGDVERHRSVSPLTAAGETTRLLAGSFSVDMAAWSGPAAVPGARVETCAGSSARVDQILLSMAMVADQVETLTLVVSNPEVNNLRINRSRSTDSESSNSIARQPPVCRTTLPGTKTTALMKGPSRA